MILVRQHGESGPPGLLEEWLDARGLAYEISDSRATQPDAREYTAVASLGCRYCPADIDVPQVAGELRLIEQAVEHDVPVLGLCFAARCSRRLGGDIERAPTPSSAGARLRRPPGAREIARTKDAIQAFRYGRHLGVQFHPESTVDIVAGWARKDAERLNALGIEDAHALIAAPAERKETARHAAFRLFDAFRRRERMIEERGLMARPGGLTDAGVTSVRVIYSDLHGVPAARTSRSASSIARPTHGLAFCAAIMGTDLRHTPVVGGEEGYPDLIAKPDLSTLTLAAVGAGPGVVPRRPASGRGQRPRPRRPARRRPPGGRGVRGARLQPDRRPGVGVLPVRAPTRARPTACGATWTT